MTIIRSAMKSKAENELDRILLEVEAAGEKAVKGTPLMPADICRVLSSPKSAKTLRSHMVAALARHYEEELVKKMEEDGML